LIPEKKKKKKRTDIKGKRKGCEKKRKEKKK